MYEPKLGGGGIDADAQAFITAASITDSTQQSAINTLVTSLKSANIWTKMKAIYPFVGGTAESHRFNLKNTTQYKIDWFGGGSHTSIGYVPNGLSFGSTYLSNDTMSQNSCHISVYATGTNFSGGCDVGSYQGNWGTMIYSRQTYFETTVNSNSISYPGYTTRKGFNLASRTTSNSIFSQFNQTQTTYNTTSSTPKTAFFNISKPGGWNGDYSTRQLGLVSIGDGLTNGEAISLYNAVLAYQTTLSRQ